LPSFGGSPARVAAGAAHSPNGGNLLNAGVSIDEIAAQDCVTLKRMRNLVREVLARRMPRPPAEYAALQVSRLNEALLVPYSAMAGANLAAVDRVAELCANSTAITDPFPAMSGRGPMSRGSRRRRKARSRSKRRSPRRRTVPGTLPRIDAFGCLCFARAGVVPGHARSPSPMAVMNNSQINGRLFRA